MQTNKHRMSFTFSFIAKSFSEEKNRLVALSVTSVMQLILHPATLSMWMETVFHAYNQDNVCFQQRGPVCPLKLQSCQSHNMIVLIAEE